MSLTHLSDEIARIGGGHLTTPVLVTPKHLSLRFAFIEALVDQIIDRIDGDELRLDWCYGQRSLLSGHWARHKTKRMNAKLGAKLAAKSGGAGMSCPRASVVVTSMIARPAINARTFVLGLCDENLDLPQWTTAIRLGCAATPAKPKHDVGFRSRRLAMQ